MAIIEYKDNIQRDTAVYPPNVYAGDEQGCGTVWYKSVKQARKVIRSLGRIPEGRDAGLCGECSCHYSFGTKEHRQYPEFVCRKWKEQIAEGRVLA